jgi:hypothetical protein
MNSAEKNANNFNRDERNYAIAEFEDAKALEQGL